MSLQLHPKLGPNPHLTFCPRCGGDGPDLILIGARTAKRKCAGCGTLLIGNTLREPCGKCGDTGPHELIGHVEEHEKLPGSFCKSCEEEIKLHKAIVKDGGVYFRCQECGKQGVIRPNEFAAAVRKTHGLTNGEPCGVEFSKCSEHGVEEEVG